MTEVVNPRLQARLPDYLATWLASRAERMHTGSLNQQATMELGLWQSTLEFELRRIVLTLPQARAIMAVCNSRLLSPTVSTSPAEVWRECYDAFRIARENDPLGISSYAAQYGTDEQQLLGYLSTLGPAADAALRDAITRWWQQDEPDTVEGFAAVGLRVLAAPESEAAS